MRQTDLNIKSGRIEVNSFGVTLNRGICQQPWNYFLFQFNGGGRSKSILFIGRMCYSFNRNPQLNLFLNRRETNNIRCILSG